MGRHPWTTQINFRKIVLRILASFIYLDRTIGYNKKRQWGNMTWKTIS